MSNKILSSKPRMYYIDNIRTYLTILVILHHVAVGYGGSGGWPIKEQPTDAVSPIIFLLFNALNQSYFMSFFFILAVYFTPRSLERKGGTLFIKDRLIRLGIPLFLYVLILAPVTSWLVTNYAHNMDVSFSEILRDVWNVTSLQSISFGHLWFLEALLIFALIYVAYTNVSDREKQGSPINLYPNSFPANRAIVLSIGVLSVVTFLVRIGYPIGVWVFSLSPSHMTHYVFSFIVGILAYRGDWFNRLQKDQAKLWGKIALMNTLALPILFVLGVSGGASEDIFMGGVSWQAFMTATWESISFLSISIWLLDLFKYRFNYVNKVLSWMAPNVFATYIFHQVIIVAIMIPLLGVTWPSALKFIVVSIIGVPLCFLVSSLIRKVPYVDRFI